MKYVLSAVLLMSLSIPAIAHQSDKDREIQQLKQEVRMLKREVRELKSRMGQDSNSTENLNINRNANRTQWGCYIDDVSAGGIYGTGSTEAEARGKTLQKCNAKGGACFDQDVKCSQSN